MLEHNRSTMDLATKNSAGEARERRWESTFFMLNVIFLLILFFIVAANFDVQLQIFPPKSDASNSLPADAVELTVTREGALFLNGEAITRQALPKKLRELGAGRDLKIAADANLDAVKVAQIIQEVSAAGVVRLAIVTVARDSGTGAPE
ncbi:MAG: biopolymer transporter ExbD [Gammaproteobacteria bacterium]|nr:biopolymer transporter ExbD [Gammaproteobacteria bacterium]